MISYSKIVIERSKNAKKTSRFGIILEYLPKSFRKFLIKHQHMYRWAQSDQFVECILKMQKPAVKNASALKLYWDHENQLVVNKQELIDNYNTIDWICALSGKPIKAKFMNFDLDNFLHEEYYDALTAPTVDSRILKSSIEFRKKCKKLLLDEREEFLNIARKNSKKSLD